MALSSEQLGTVASELKRIGADLNLSEGQKQKLTFITEASEEIHEYKQQNPSATREDLIKKVIDNRVAKGCTDVELELLLYTAQKRVFVNV